MLSIPASVRVFIHRKPVDFRKSHDGLCGIVRSELKENPLSGDVFAFLNRRSDRVKLIQWDGNGLWMHYKRLEKGTFRIPTTTDKASARMTRGDLAMLLDGIELKKGKLARRFDPTLRIGSRQSDDDKRRSTPNDGTRAGRASDSAASSDCAVGRTERHVGEEGHRLSEPGVRAQDREAPRDSGTDRSASVPPVRG